MRITAPRRGVVGRSLPLVAALIVQAGTSYLTLIIAGRLLGAARFSGVSALYVIVSSVATGLFLPLEQEIARRRGHERVSSDTDPNLVRRAAAFGISVALAVCAVSLLAHGFTLRLLADDRSLLAAMCVALPGYACCFVSRGVFAGSGELTRYGIQLGTEGASRLAGVSALAATGTHSAACVGWLFGVAPWLALGVSFLGRRKDSSAQPDAAHSRPLVRPLGWLLVSSMAAQLLVNAGPLVIQILTTSAERAQAGAFLAALVVVRVPVFLFTAVAPSFLPAMAAHVAAGRRDAYVELLRRVLVACAATGLISTGALALVGPALLRLLFGFRDGLGSGVFLAMGLSVGLFLVATVLAQSLLSVGRHAATTFGWLIGVGGLALGTAIEDGPVNRATAGFLLGALAAAIAFAALLTAQLRSLSMLGVPPASRPTAEGD